MPLSIAISSAIGLTVALVTGDVPAAVGGSAIGIALAAVLSRGDQTENAEATR